MTNTNEIVITIKDLASELFIQPKSLRKKLRDNNIPKPGTRWEWSEDNHWLPVIRSWKDQAQKTVKKEIASKEVPQLIEEPIEEPVQEILELVEPAQEFVTLYTKETGKGTWTVIEEEAGVKAIYTTEKATDATKWINGEDDIRATLPKYIKAIIGDALSRRRR